MADPPVGAAAPFGHALLAPGADMEMSTLSCRQCNQDQTLSGEASGGRSPPTFGLAGVPVDLVPCIADFLDGRQFPLSAQLCASWRAAIRVLVEQTLGACTSLPTEGLWWFLELQERCTELLGRLQVMSASCARHTLRTGPVGRAVADNVPVDSSPCGRSWRRVPGGGWGYEVFRSCQVLHLESSDADASRRPGGGLPAWLPGMPVARPPHVCQLSPRGHRDIEVTAFLRNVRHRSAVDAPDIGRTLLCLAHFFRSCGASLRFVESRAEASWAGENGCVHLSEQIAWSVRCVLQDDSFQPHAVEVLSVVAHTLYAETCAERGAEIVSGWYSQGVADQPQCCVM